MSKNFREPVSGFTHLFGALVSLVGLIALIYKEIYIGQNSILGMIGVVIFGLSLIFLYTASTVYHLAVSSEGVIKMLRKLDHSMIFVLIAGTYTPICLIALESYWRWGLFICVWLLALIGIVFKFFWIDCPKWLSSSFYVGLGWLALAAFSPLSKVLPFQGMALLILGGILYTVGAVIYCLEKKGKKRTFGAHEIFHIFVLLGSLAHYILVFKYII
ncbi:MULTISPECIES: PAQR family membrane homeostasis protein TrhA [unclassified Clostridium]|uniref:PAQR family membrane homeostasis protein TrhA n=1 Tax=unclassified Clostridium TaxID=2614128 RepID=UPI0025BF3772|nr:MULTISPECIES: hemolysin III family protein [unclassified Clostridium]